MWFGHDEELNTESFTGAMNDLLTESLLMAQDQKLAAFSPLCLLRCLLQTKVDDETVLRIPQPRQTEFRNAILLMRNHLNKGVLPQHFLDLYDALTVPGTVETNLFLREHWPAPLAALLERMPPDVTVQRFLYALLADREAIFGDNAPLLGAFLTDFEAPSEGVSLFSGETFNQAVIQKRLYRLMERSLRIASEYGHPTVGILMLLYAMLQVGETYTNLLLRNADAQKPPHVVKACFDGAFQTQRRGNALPMARASFDEPLAALLQAAMDGALATGCRQFGERDLLAALFASGNLTALGFVERTLGWPVKMLADRLNDLPENEEIEPLLPQGNYPVLSLTGVRQAYVHRKAEESELIKALLRKDCPNVMLIGESGCGRTALMTRVAQTLGEGSYASLSCTPMVYMDLSALGNREYSAAMQSLFTFMEDNPERIYVLDGFYRYFTENIRGVTSQLTANAYKLVMILTPQEHTALQSPKDADDLQVITQFLQENVTKVQLGEPTREETLAIIEQAFPSLARTYNIQPEEGVAAALYRMCNDYMISQRFPKKAIRLLNQTASDIAAEAELSGQANPMLSKESIAQRLSELTELPAETILGLGADKDYDGILGKAVVGQGVAVAKVADRMDLVQKGLVEKNKPAAIFLFAGLSGTGKTELAKQIAQVYSRSRKLITFEMATFSESHSVSGLIGSPPGYTGYEEGGRLINALNRDPYSVVLLDEVEKAHPAVWDPFLNLFDEGVITDRRGVVAYGHKAFFVMTSNVGQYEIVDMLNNGEPLERIEETVTLRLGEARFEPEKGSMSQRCFRPEFLGRILPRGGIVVFNALSLEAMKGIAGHRARALCKNHTATHEHSTLDIDDGVIDYIAGLAFRQNEKAIEQRASYMGGRPLAGLMDRYITTKLSARIRQIADAPLVRVIMNGEDTDIVPVYGDGEVEKHRQMRRAQLVGTVAAQLNRLLAVDPGMLHTMNEDQLSHLDVLLSQLTMRTGVNL